jgi:hypothetical protein
MKIRHRWIVVRDRPDDGFDRVFELSREIRLARQVELQYERLLRLCAEPRATFPGALEATSASNTLPGAAASDTVNASAGSARRPRRSGGNPFTTNNVAR